MKSKFNALLLGIATASVATFATQIEITPWPVGEESFSDMQDLDHYKAYKWKLNLDYFYQHSSNYVPNSTWEITSAKLEIFNITNFDDNTNILRADLLDLSTTPVVSPNSTIVYTDNQERSDWFGSPNLDLGFSSRARIGCYVDENGANTRENKGWEFSEALIDSMNDYKSAQGWVGIGLDPDCHYWNSGVKLTIDVKTTPISVPEPGSIGLLLMGLTMVGGVALSRKKRS
jgi:hypothetical protein